VVYLDPLAGVVDRALRVSLKIRGIVLDVLRSVGGSMAMLVEAVVRVAELVIERIRFARLALLLDDVLQVIGLDRVEAYVKSLLTHHVEMLESSIQLHRLYSRSLATSFCSTFSAVALVSAVV